jgi:hypothetical protein
MRGFLFIGSIVAVALVFAASAAAVPSPGYQLNGIAFGGQGSTSTLVGNGTGSTGDRASWRASVTSSPLAGCAAVGSSCAITGGTFTLTSSDRTQLAGGVTGGALTLAAQAGACGRQTYAITATISTPAGLQSFTGTLTTLRLAFRNTCFVLASTVQGSLAAVADDGNSL